MRKNFFSLFLGIGALSLALAMNYSYAKKDYGITPNTLSSSVLANGSDNGSGSNEGGNGGTTQKPYTDYALKNTIHIGRLPLCECTGVKPGGIGINKECEFYEIHCSGIGAIQCSGTLYYATSGCTENGSCECP